MVLKKQRTRPSPVRVRRGRGFTLFELAAVLVVIGVVSALSVPTFSSLIRGTNEGVVDRSLDAAARAGELECRANPAATLAEVVAAAATNSGNGDLAVTTGPDWVTLDLTRAGETA